MPHSMHTACVVGCKAGPPGSWQPAPLLQLPRGCAAAGDRSPVTSHPGKVSLRIAWGISARGCAKHRIPPQVQLQGWDC